MLPTNLNTNEVKNAAGTELEFYRRGPLPSNPMSLEFAWVSEVPGRPFRMHFAHQEQGDSRNKVRRSLHKTIHWLDSSQLIDATIPSFCMVTTVFQIPIGNLTTLTTIKDVGACHGSSLMSRGADSTILFNCTGVGMEALVNGSL